MARSARRDVEYAASRGLLAAHSAARLSRVARSWAPPGMAESERAVGRARGARGGKCSGAGRAGLPRAGWDDQLGRWTGGSQPEWSRKATPGPRPRKLHGMRQSFRTIALHCELVHPAQTPDPGPIQRVHNRMFEAGEPLYGSFTVTHEGAVLSNQAARPGVLSQVSFLTDRIRFIEERTSLGVEEFSERVRRVGELTTEQRPLPLLTGQGVTLRALITPRTTAREFLGSRVLVDTSPLGRLQRPLQGLGLRLTFGPQPGSPNAYAVRVETVAGDPRALWLEIVGTFPPIATGGAPQPAQAWETVQRNLQATYDFATGEVLDCLEAFEKGQEPDEGSFE